MVVSMAGPLYSQDVAVLRKATAVSLAFDVRAELMLVRARCFYENLKNTHLPSSGLYECLLGGGLADYVEPITPKPLNP